MSSAEFCFVNSLHTWYPRAAAASPAALKAPTAMLSHCSWKVTVYWQQQVHPAARDYACKHSTNITPTRTTLRKPRQRVNSGSQAAEQHTAKPHGERHSWNSLGSSIATSCSNARAINDAVCQSRVCQASSRAVRFSHTQSRCYIGLGLSM